MRRTKRQVRRIGQARGIFVRYTVGSANGGVGFVHGGRVQGRGQRVARPHRLEHLPHRWTPDVVCVAFKVRHAGQYVMLERSEASSSWLDLRLIASHKNHSGWLYHRNEGWEQRPLLPRAKPSGLRRSAPVALRLAGPSPPLLRCRPDMFLATGQEVFAQRASLRFLDSARNDTQTSDNEKAL